MNPFREIFFCIFLSFPFFVFGQLQKVEKKDTTENIIIYGDSFLFIVHQPAGWRADMDNVKAMNANIMFYRSNDTFKVKSPLVQVFTYKKQDEQVDKDFEYELLSIKEKNPQTREQNIEVNNMNGYLCFAKVAYVENESYQYIAYINPGSHFRNAFSVIMTVLRRRATTQELAAFKEIVYTLVVFKR